MKILFILFILITGTTSIVFISVYNRFDANRFIIEESILQHKKKLSQPSLGNQSYSVEIYDRNEILIGKYYPEEVSKMTLKQCKKIEWLKKATIAAEDQDFYSHHGISWTGIIRAVIHNILAGSFKEGAGSLTQQLARHLFAKPQDLKLTRKIYETYIARIIEKNMTKDEIICSYLNEIYMGEGRQGANEAAQFYFRKKPEQLDAAESAMIVGIFPAPSIYSPLNNIELALKKQKTVLRRMVEEKYLSAEEETPIFQNFKKTYEIAEHKAYARSGTIGLYDTNKKFAYNEAPDVNEYVRRFLSEQVPLHTYTIDKQTKEIKKEKNKEAKRGKNKEAKKEKKKEKKIQAQSTPKEKRYNVIVHTSIDIKKQKDATNAVRNFITHTVRNDAMKNFSLTLSSKEKELILNGFNGVFLSLDTVTGDILAMISGFSDSDQNYYNRAFNMKRQPGSTIKALVYTSALENHVINPPYMLEDVAINIKGYSPRNSYSEYLGPLSLAQAIAYSSNTTSVQTLYNLGMNSFFKTLVAMTDILPNEIEQRFPRNLTLALGSGELTPMELASIYSTIANTGVRTGHRLIKKIQMGTGEVIIDNSIGNMEFSTNKILTLDKDTINKNFEPIQVISQDTSLRMQYLLQKATTIEGGTVNWIYKKLQKEGIEFPFGAKTGSIQTSSIEESNVKYSTPIKDAWFAAIVPNETNVIWIGHDQGVPFTGSGSSSAGQIWINYVRTNLVNTIPQNFPMQKEIDIMKREFKENFTSDNLQIQEIIQKPPINMDILDTNPIEDKKIE